MKDAFGDFAGQLADAIAARVADRLRPLLPSEPDPHLLDDAGEVLHPDRFYTAKELAERWGFSRTASVYEIPEAELPRRRVGASRGKTLFYGLDIMRYEDTISEEQYRAVQKRRGKIDVEQRAPKNVRRMDRDIRGLR